MAVVCCDGELLTGISLGVVAAVALLGEDRFDGAGGGVIRPVTTTLASEPSLVALALSNAEQCLRRRFTGYPALSMSPPPRPSWRRQPTAKGPGRASTEPAPNPSASIRRANKHTTTRLLREGAV
jgi:hypothetical protein